MTSRYSSAAVVAVAVGYLALLSWAMGNFSYDIWGVLIIAPVLALLGVFGARRLFRDEFAPLVPVMYLGLAAKFAGAAVRFFVAFDVYGGNSDAQQYHKYARAAAADVWAGRANVSTILPSGTGTQFMDRFTAFLYTFTGYSKLAAFLLFSWFAFWGVAFFVKAACIAVPGLQRRRYATLCMLAPTLVYWPSSIGKEAYMIFWLGLAAYGIAMMLSRRGLLKPVIVITLGLAGATAVRPHMAGLFIAGLLPALLVVLIRGRDGRVRERGLGFDRVALAVVLVIALAALAVVGTATVRYLNPSGDDTVATSDRISNILTETTRRTSDGDSNFAPPSVSGPLDWPYASLRTLTRPLPTEAQGIGQLLSAAEIIALLGLCTAAYKRVLRLPGLLISNPYITFAMIVMFFGGLAYSTFANLGLLTRQRSLLFPMMLLVPCLPLTSMRDRSREAAGRSADRADPRNDALVSAASGVSPRGNDSGAIRSDGPRR
jgi:hypothetical protein